MFSNNLVLKRTTLLGLIGNCAMCEPLSDCKLNKYRQLPYSDAEKLILNLPELEVEQIIQCCQNCIEDRLNGGET
jgi:hypothetical protein